MRNKITGLLLLFFLFLPASLSALVINEVMPANLGECIDPSWNFGGWVELYNPTATAIPLNGTVVSDHKGHSFTLGSAHGSVPAHGYKNLWFGHNDETNFPAQIDFKLDCDGGTLTLSQGQQVVATVNYPAALPRNTWARTADGADSWSNATPTPEASNSTATFALSRTAPPVPDLPGGWLNGPLTLNVYVPEGADLYYTTDGTVPTTASKRADTNADGNAAFSISATTCYRFRCYKEGTLPSSVVTRSFIKHSCTKHIEGGWDIDEWGDWIWVDDHDETVDLGTATLISVTTNPDYLYDDKIGIYVDGTNGGWSYWTYANYYQDWDRPVNVEIFTPEGLPLVNQEVDMSMSGGYSRMNTVKSFKLKSNKKYEGVSYFPATDLFPDKPYLRCKDILLRTGGVDIAERQQDVALQTIVRRSGFYADTQDFRPAYVFFNGVFQDIIFLREPSNKQYGYSNYGYDTDYMDTVEESDITGVTITNGTATAFNELCKYARNAASSTSAWENVKQLLDVDEFANYFALETYLANQDWPQNNIKMFRSTDDGRFHVILQDLDACFHEFGNTFERMENNQTYGYAVAGHKENTLLTLFLNLMNREEFRQRFVTAFCLVAGSVFEPAAVSAQLDALYAEVQPAYGSSTVLAGAYADLADILSETWQQERFRYLSSWSRAKAYDYAPVSLSAEQPATLLLNGQPIPRTHFNGPLVLPATVQAQAPRGYRFTGWQRNGTVVSTDSTYTITRDGTYKAVFASQNNLNPPVIINEICANAGIYQSPHLKHSDWIELYNTTAAPVDLTGAYVSDDLDEPLKYALPASLSPVIPAYGHLILWADGQELPFKLANGDGEGLLLTAPDQSWTDTLRYVTMTVQQTVGRYPDGGARTYLLDRPTPSASNLLTSYAAPFSLPPYIPEPEPDGITPPLMQDNISPLKEERVRGHYDLQGRPVGPSYRGLYIDFNKKVIK